MQTGTEYGFVFMLGAAVYSYLEMVCRGRTHWSMMLAGGAALCWMYFMQKNMQPVGRLVRCLIGCMAITGMEFLLGLLLNRRLRLYVWDYSGLAFNVLGQVCPKYSALWFLLCFPGDRLCGKIQSLFHGTQPCAK